MTDERDPPVPKRGRPPEGLPPTSIVSVRVPVPAHDRLIKMAADRHVSVSTMIRRLLLKGLP